MEDNASTLVFCVFVGESPGSTAPTVNVHSAVVAVSTEVAFLHLNGERKQRSSTMRRRPPGASCPPSLKERLGDQQRERGRREKEALEKRYVEDDEITK